MKLGIMQPYFFPYLGYFDLINRTDRWVVFDTAQYIRHGWVNRNRVLHPTTAWQYVIVPVEKHHRETAIRDIRVNRATDWRARILGQLQHYRRKAPYFHQVLELAADCMDGDETSLSRLNVKATEGICRYLAIPFRFEVFSETNLQLGPVEGPGDWALRISEGMGAAEYWNPPGGAELFDPAEFRRHGVELKIQQPLKFTYSCEPYTFVPDLSILDVLMWNDPAAVKGYLDECRGGAGAAAELVSQRTGSPQSGESSRGGE